MKTMEALVVDAGSKLLKAGAAIPDQSPAMIIPSQMKRMVDNGSSSADNPTTVFEDVTLDPIERGLIKDWDAMEDLLRYVVYTGLGWEEGNEGNILFTDPLCTPKVRISTSSIVLSLKDNNLEFLCSLFSVSIILFHWIIKRIHFLFLFVKVFT